MIVLADTHCHLDDASFDADRAAVVARARARGVRAQLLPAVTAASWLKLKAVAASDPGLFPCYGLHPICLDQHVPAHLELLAEWLAAERPLALGECGLDFYLPELEPAVQMQYFEAQLVLARRFELPLLLHARRAVEAVILALRRHGPLRGVVHSYAGSAEQARQLVGLGFYFGLGGPITYPRARKLRELAASLPAERILIETDAPDQPLCGRQGVRNEPAAVADVLQCWAGLRGVPESELASQLNDNAVRLFGPRLALALAD